MNCVLPQYDICGELRIKCSEAITPPACVIIILVLLFFPIVMQWETSPTSTKLLHTRCISYKNYVTSEEVCAKIQQAIGPHDGHFTIVKRRKLKWYGHIFRSSGLAKTILQGTVKGGRRQGRQKKRWEDNSRKWTGGEFAKSQMAVENREKLIKLF